MGHQFVHKPFEWKNEGQAPTESEINLGFQGGMSLPAPYLNKMWTDTYNAIKEVQDLLEAETIDSQLDDTSRNPIQNKPVAEAIGTLEDSVISIITDIAAVETSPAIAAHAKDSYIIYGGKLYKALTAIAVGDTLTNGINITLTTVAAELGSAIDASGIKIQDVTNNITYSAQLQIYQGKPRIAYTQI